MNGHGFLVGALVAFFVVIVAYEEHQRIVARVVAADRKPLSGWDCVDRPQREGCAELQTTSCPVPYDDDCDVIWTMQTEAAAADAFGDPGPWCAP